MHVMLSPLKPGGSPASAPARPDDPGQSSKVTANDSLPPVPGLATALTARMGMKDRCFVNRNVVAAVLTLLSSLKPEHVKGPDKSACLAHALPPHPPIPTLTTATRTPQPLVHTSVA
jgi:hypothetical protein